MRGFVVAVVVGGAVEVEARAACNASGTVVINEYMADPSAPGGDGDAEWVELYNTGATSVSLEGWRIERALDPGSFSTSFEVPAGVVLAPGAWVVLAGPASGLSGANIVALAQQQDMGNASTSSDAVQLVACDGSVRDVIAYGTSNTRGVFVDEELEDIPDIKLAPKPSSGRSTARLADGVDTNNPAADFATATATPGVSNGGGGGPSPSCATPGERGLVWINELFADPGAGTNPSGSSDSGYEWIELFNPGSAPVDLSGWTVQQAGSPADWGRRIKLTFPAGATIAAGGYLVVADPLIAFDAAIEAITVRVTEVSTLALGQSEDGVRLVACDDEPVDQVVYGGANPDGFADLDDVALLDEQIAPEVSTDQALARRADGLSSGNLRDDFVTAAPTPGEPNVDLVCRTTGGRVFLNEILPNPSGADDVAASEFVELFNDGAAAIDLSGWSIAKATSLSEGVPNVDVIFTLPPNTTVDAGGFLVVGGVAAVEATLFSESFDLPSGSDGDLVLLLDCEGRIADRVLYGGENTDLLPEDDGYVPADGAPDPDDDQCVARLGDGTDTNVSAQDFVTTRYCTAGATNVRVTPGGDDTGVDTTGPTGGCGGGPTGPREVTPGGPGCAVAGGADAGGGLAGAVGLMLGLGWRRRRR